MGFFARWMGNESSAPVIHEENVLVISDIHLGEDVLTEGPEHLGSYIRVLNRELAGFVEAHAKHRMGTRRWHLVINGDMFDFVKVSLRPDAEEAYVHWSNKLSDEERDQLPNTSENVVWKLGRILEIHRPLFRQLGNFILQGNRVTIIEGNHDAEFFFPEVQKSLRDFVVTQALRVARDQGTQEPAVEQLQRRIEFRHWFEASAGRYHIEHGHQHDQYCSFEYNLAPTERHGRQIATPMSHRIMPYFAELLGDFSSHGVDRWSAADWVRFAFSLGPKMLWILLKVYVTSMGELLTQSGRHRAADLKGLKKQHLLRLKKLAEKSHYGIATLRALDRLTAIPAEYSFFKMLHLFYVDRLVVILSLPILWGLAALVGGKVGLWLGVATLISGVVVLWGLARMPSSASDRVLRRAAAKIADLTGARYVVFGHSHHPELVNLKARYGVGRYGETAFYFNSGSWVTREILRGEKGEGMSYVELTAEGGYLKRWQGQGVAPMILGASRGRRKGDVNPKGPKIQSEM